MSAVIDGACPSCGHRGMLALDRACRVRCGSHGCPDPGLVQSLLDKPDQHVHLIEFRADGITCQHPLVERAEPGVVDCPLVPEFEALTEPPSIGMFRVPPGGTLSDAEPVEQDFTVAPPPPPPLAPVTGMPLGTMWRMQRGQVPPNCMALTERRVRLDAADYPALAELIGVDDDGWLTFQIDDFEYLDDPDFALVMRVQ